MNSGPAPYFFEALADHDKAAFACGIAELDHYLRQQASQDAKRKVAAPFVMVDLKRRIAGYYTLSAYGIRGQELPPAIAKKLPLKEVARTTDHGSAGHSRVADGSEGRAGPVRVRYPLIPATLLGRLAVSRDYQGQKLGRLLLMDALHRSWKNTTEVASVGVIAEAIDNSARDFYLHHEFIPVLEHPRRLFIAMKTTEKLFG